ncbi:hypothetical protein LOC70_12850 [Rhodopirellula sp. JC737]|nr:hypothetical protein [Rhodopirellula sp. JC737]
MAPASRDDWNTLEPPTVREQLDYTASFDLCHEGELSAGLVPECMEDKWFVYRDGDWLYFHRSWTGALIYWVKLDFDTQSIAVSESWVNRESEQYSSTDTAYDRALVDYLIRGLLLKEQVLFPMPKMRGIRGLLFKLAGKAMMFQHSIVGSSSVPIRTVDDSRSG